MARSINKTKKIKQATINSTLAAPERMLVLFTVVNRNKTDFYVDLLHNYEINLELVLSAQGTASDKVMSLLGLTDNEKSVIISAVRADRAKEVLSVLEEKFRTVRGGKGIAYTVPMASTIGVAIYQFLSNKTGGGIIQ